MKDSKVGFASLGLSKELQAVVRELGYEQATPIQAQSIPVLLEGGDLIGQSKTGSGKTAAFTLPVLQKINLDTRAEQALVLCPTRELCTQVAREMKKLARRHSGLQILILAGGQPIHPQLDALAKGVHIVVGTPGRVLDVLRRNKLDLSGVKTVILDEADRMLDMGFEEDMQEILRALPPARQTVLFSATFPDAIEELSRAYQKKPTRVTIDDSGEAAPEIVQLVYETHEKLSALFWVLKQHKPDSAIIFCNMKTTVNDVTESLLNEGVSVACLHGDLEQRDRDREMAKFRNKSTRILVATDVAARGIDIENLDLVVNFDFPKQAEVYVHRIGRTGRAGKAGLAITLASPREKIDVRGAIRKPAGAVEQLDLGPSSDAEMATIFIAGGRKDKLRPADILGALTGEAAGLEGNQIGKIEIHDRFSYVAVKRNVAELALERLQAGRIKGRRFRVEPVR